MPKLESAVSPDADLSMLLKRSRMHWRLQNVEPKVVENCNGGLMRIAAVLEAQFQQVAGIHA